MTERDFIPWFIVCFVAGFIVGWTAMFLVAMAGLRKIRRQLEAARGFVLERKDQ